MKRRLVLLVGLVAVATVFAAPVQVDNAGWSEPVSGIQARFSFEEGPLGNGTTRLTKIYLELRNVSDRASPIYLQYDPGASIKAQLFDSAGNPVKITGNPASIWVSPPFLICLPNDSTLKLNVTAEGYGVPKDEKALIGLLSGDWVIKKDDSSEYFLGGTFVAEKPKEKTEQKLWVGEIQIPMARVDVLNKKAPDNSTNHDKQ
jgi:hypothetical protein